MRYATEQSFGGQRASVGRAVLISVVGADGAPRLRAGLIVSIREDDMPRITDVQAPETGPHPLEFAPASTVADAERLPVGSWTWPPRLP